MLMGVKGLRDLGWRLGWAGGWFSGRWFSDGGLGGGWRWVSWGLVLVLAIALVSCGSSGGPAVSGSKDPLVLSILSDPKTFNPALSTESPNIFGLTYEGLTMTNGLTNEIEPDLAEGWEVSEDGSRIVFTLRSGLRWSDGHPLTAEDVVFSFQEVYFNEKIPSSGQDIFRIGAKQQFPAVRQLDSRRVEFRLPEPFAPFIRACGIEVLPAHALRSSVRELDPDGNPRFLTTWGTDTPPNEVVVNGPYLLEQYRASQRVIFRRNPYYWRSPEPNIERIVWQVVESQDTGFLQFRSGNLDSISVRPEDFELLKREEERNRFTVFFKDEPTPGITFITFNLNQGRNPKTNKPLVDPIKARWFNTVAFRQAIAYGINRQTMVENTYRGLGRPINSQVSVQSPYYLSPDEGLPTYEYDLEKAKQLLEGAGFQVNNRGELLDQDGHRVRFTLMTNAGNNVREKMGAQIKQDLGKLGIQVDFQPLSWSAVLEKLDNSLDWDCVLLGFGGGPEPHFASNLWSVDGRLHFFNSSLAGQEGVKGRTVAPWEQRIADVYVQAAQAVDEAQRKALYGETQRLTQTYLPLIQLVNPLSMVAVRDRIQGIRYSTIGGAFWNISELTLEE